MSDDIIVLYRRRALPSAAPYTRCISTYSMFVYIIPSTPLLCSTKNSSRLTLHQGEQIMPMQLLQRFKVVDKQNKETSVARWQRFFWEKVLTASDIHEGILYVYDLCEASLASRKSHASVQKNQDLRLPSLQSAIMTVGMSVLHANRLYFQGNTTEACHPVCCQKNLKVRIYKTVKLPVVVYGCETWTLTLREEQRLRVFENKVLRKIFGTKRDDVTGEWRKIYNAELHALYSSPDIIRNIKSRRLRWAGHVARMSESRNAYKVLVGRPEGKRPFRRPRRRWEDTIKINLREVGYDGRDWINLAQDRELWRARAAMKL
ncbi:hypothetical protein ANN_01315 [Periplaneta americana]|uniref:Uncharacterized protein n=1 Tax=Periplaneta americana TaxID=6978 RepID=A0ABQ8TT76_PERAM|nr:hypothetical protein ANN_01315 [Periplaneta americana]